jgi:hypothetical protein
MTETAPVTLESLKAAALARREREAREREEAELLERQAGRAEWLRLLEQVGLDHPYFVGLIDEAAGGIARETAWDGVHAWRQARLYAALPGHVAVEFRYHKDSEGRWAQHTFAGKDEGTSCCKLYAVPRRWYVEPKCADGVSYTYVTRTDDLGEALLAAEDSYKEKCLKTKEAVRARDRLYASTRKKVKPPTPDEQLLWALKDLFRLLKEEDEAAEREYEETLAGGGA